MHIVLEGLDRCGKSTLSHYLKSYFRTPVVIHSSAPPKTVKQEDAYYWELGYYTDVSEFVGSSKNVSFILDRFHLGTHVYGTKYRNYIPTQSRNIISATEKNLRHSTILILLTDYPEAIAARDDSLSLESNLNDYEESRQKFIEAYEFSVLKKIHINISDIGGFSELNNRVKDFIATCKQ